jgi:epoxide hydrolase 4
MSIMPRHLPGLLILLAASSTGRADKPYEEGYADSSGIKIHYVTVGKGPVIILLHGFPDYWNTWRDQLPALAQHFQAVAIDLRGYNKSDQPHGLENYTMEKLVGDVDAVRRHFKQKRVIVLGHDWGGAIAWAYAMMHPEQTEKLIVLNLPHPRGLQRELANNPEQQRNSAYARKFQEPDAASKLNAQLLAFWVKEPEARQKYVEAFKRSSIEGMLNYYKANYPRPPYKNATDYPQVKCPVLMIHGLKDIYLLPGALNDNWKWVDQDFTLVTNPRAGHFVHRDAPEFVTATTLDWLTGARVGGRPEQLHQK